MIQRILYKALTEGLAYYRANPEAFDRLFGENYGLPTTEVDAIKQFFAEHPPKVNHGYARMDQDPPLYAIVLADERETETVLGDEAGMINDDDDDPDYGSDQYAVFWEHTYHIMCVAEHPEAAQYVYEVAKAVILAAKPTFLPEGIYGIKVSGSELLPDPRFIPEHWFVRQITLYCQRELLTVKIGSAADKVNKVAGIHVDNDGVGGDVGEVKTLVKLYGVDEDG